MKTALREVAYLQVADGQAAIRFYENAFGAKALKAAQTENRDDSHFGTMAICGGVVTLGEAASDAASNENGPASKAGPSGAISLRYRSRQDFKAAFFQSLAAGATATMHPQRTAAGNLMAEVRDPEGHLWALTAPI